MAFTIIILHAHEKLYYWYKGVKQILKPFDGKIFVLFNEHFDGHKIVNNLQIREEQFIRFPDYSPNATIPSKPNEIMKTSFVTFKYFFAIVIIAFMLGCSHNNEQEPLIIPINQLPTNPAYVIYPMQGTTWKLLGFANLIDSTFRYAKPQNNFSYKLCFTTDSTFTGTSSTNEIYGDCSYDINMGTIEVIAIGGSKRGEINDGWLYWESIQQVETFSISEYGLYLYFDNGFRFLLYIPLSR